VTARVNKPTHATKRTIIKIPLAARSASSGRQFSDKTRSLQRETMPFYPVPRPLRRSTWSRCARRSRTHSGVCRVRSRCLDPAKSWSHNVRIGHPDGFRDAETATRIDVPVVADAISSNRPCRELWERKGRLSCCALLRREAATGEVLKAVSRSTVNLQGALRRHRRWLYYCDEADLVIYRVLSRSSVVDLAAQIQGRDETRLMDRMAVFASDPLTCSDRRGEPRVS